MSPKAATTVAKRLETQAIFWVISDILIVCKYLPSPPINVVMDLVMTFKVTSNNIERGRGWGVESHLLSRGHFRWKSIFSVECLDNFAAACSFKSTNLQIKWVLCCKYCF